MIGYMDHSKHYNKLIEKAKNRVAPSGYVEKHHIIPRSLGGSDKACNIVVLTAREHFVAHQLLAHIHGGKMWYALWMMSNARRYGSRHYGWIAENYGKTQRGKTLSIETRRKMSDTRKGKRPSDATIAAAAKANSLLVRTEEHRRKLGIGKQKPIYQFAIDGKLLNKFPSIKSASKSTGLKELTLSRAVTGKRKSAIVGDYRWTRND